MFLSKDEHLRTFKPNCDRNHSNYTKNVFLIRKSAQPTMIPWSQFENQLTLLQSWARFKNQHTLLQSWAHF